MTPEQFGLLSEEELAELERSASKVERVLIANIHTLWKEKVQDVALLGIAGQALKQAEARENAKPDIGISAEELASMKARCDAATPGPWNEPDLWIRCRPEDYGVKVTIGDGNEERSLFDTFNRDSRIVILDQEVDESGICLSDHQAHKDLFFAANARTDLPRLIAALEKLVKP